MNGAAPLTAQRVEALLDAVHDPEIPNLSIADLGILREVSISGHEVRVVITPTYSGCPAMQTIEDDIRAVLGAAGCTEVRIETRLAPAWTTAWMTADARRKLRDVGIAPPPAGGAASCGHPSTVPVACPRCDSRDTELVSQFGSTACKALYRCRVCLEPFDAFKCL